jgi:hypothetical protein
MVVTLGIVSGVCRKPDHLLAFLAKILIVHPIDLREVFLLGLMVIVKSGIMNCVDHENKPPLFGRGYSGRRVG